MQSSEVNLNYIWQFKYKNYQSATAFQESYNVSMKTLHSGGFNSPEWLGKQKGMLANASEGSLPRPSSITEFLLRQKFDNLLDWGGGPGWIWAYLLKTNLHGQLNYFNLELESSKLAFEYLTQYLPRMKFVDFGEITSLAHENNLLYGNSILQYFDDNSVLLKIIKEISPISIVLDDIAGHEEEFFSLQNYYGFLQVNRFLNLNKLISEVVGLGYKLSVNRPYEKNFSATMIPKIWIGAGESVEFEAPSSVTLVFDRI